MVSYPLCICYWLRNITDRLNVLPDVLDFTKAETGNMHVESIAFPVESLLVSTVRMHVLQAQSKGIRLFLRLDRAVPEVAISDPFRIRQILMVRQVA